MIRANYIAAPHFFQLNMACRILTEAYGFHVYLVGSALLRRDYRDVDVRMILPDAEFDAMFPGIGSGHHLDARWSLMCSAISLYLAQHSGLPVDFQIQRMTEANKEHPRAEGHDRSALGLFLNPQPASTP